MKNISLKLNRWAHYISCLFMIVLMLMTVMDVVGRTFGNSVRGSYELTELFLVVIVFFGLGYAHHYKDHVQIDLLYDRMPVVVQKVFYTVSSVIYLTIVGLMVWRLFLYSGRMYDGGYVTATLDIPLGIAVILAMVGAVFYALAVLTNLLSFKEWEG